MHPSFFELPFQCQNFNFERISPFPSACHRKGISQRGHGVIKHFLPFFPCLGKPFASQRDRVQGRKLRREPSYTEKNHFCLTLRISNLEKRLIGIEWKTCPNALIFLSSNVIELVQKTVDPKKFTSIIGLTQPIPPNQLQSPTLVLWNCL